MHAACPWLVTWDDHEVQNDYAGLDGGRQRSAGRELRRAARRRLPGLLRAHAGARRADARSPGSRRRRAAHVFAAALRPACANLVLLDNRQYRDPQVCTRAGQAGLGIVDPADCPAWNDPARTLARRRAGAMARRARSRSRPQGWTVHRPADAVRPARLRGRGRASCSGTTAGTATAPRARRLTQSLQRHQVANPVLFGGDVHENWVGHVKADYAQAGQPQRRRRVLRHQHHLALGRQRPRTAERLAGKPALRVRRCAAPGLRRRRIHAGRS